MRDQNIDDQLPKGWEKDAFISGNLEEFGQYLIQREGYRRQDCGEDAIRYYLTQKHNWLPKDVLYMPEDELRFAVAEEMQAWKQLFGIE
jgi:hypothetical protein